MEIIHQRLTSDTVSHGSRIMIPTYILGAWFFGLMFIIDPQERALHSPIFEFQRDIFPMFVWGSLFLAAGIAMTITFFMHNRKWFVYFLFTFGCVILFWTAMLFISTLHNPHALLTLPAWTLMNAISTLATGRSLMRGSKL